MRSADGRRAFPPGPSPVLFRKLRSFVGGCIDNERKSVQFKMSVWT